MIKLNPIYTLMQKEAAMPEKDKILIVDDSRTMRLLLRQALESFDFAIYEAENGEQALEFFPNINPDAILLDIEMPKLNGFDTCVAIRKLPGGAHIPILITTSLDDMEAINKAYEIKATDFITKPMNWDLIGHRVRYIIRTSKDYLELQKSKQKLQQTQEELANLNSVLEQRIEASIAQLKETNQELSTTLEALKTAQEKVIMSEKMATFGNLVSGIAKEFKVPIESCLKQIALLKQLLDPIIIDFHANVLKRTALENFLENSRLTVKMLLLNLHRTANLVTSFKQIAIDQAVEVKTQFVLKNYLEEIVFNLNAALKEKQVDVIIDCPTDIVLETYAGSFFRVITILLINSLTHGFEYKETGLIRIEITQLDENLLLKYSDNGKGIPVTNLTRIFEPFFTTKSESGFVGLGLHIAYKQVTQILGGRISCDSSEDEGVTFQILLPV